MFTELLSSLLSLKLNSSIYFSLSFWGMINSPLLPQTNSYLTWKVRFKVENIPQLRANNILLVGFVTLLLTMLSFVSSNIQFMDCSLVRTRFMCVHLFIGKINWVFYLCNSYKERKLGFFYNWRDFLKNFSIRIFERPFLFKVSEYTNIKYKRSYIFVSQSPPFKRLQIFICCITFYDTDEMFGLL